MSQACRPAADAANWGGEYQYDAVETLSIRMGPNGFPLVPGKINGEDVQVFLDTGNFFGPQIAPRLARALRLKLSGAERKNYASDGTYRYSQKGYLADSFTVFRTTHANIELFEMRDDAFEASVGVSGLLDGRFTLDYRNLLMGVSRRPYKNGGTDMDELPLVWNDALKGMIVVAGEVNGVGTLVQIDTGKSRTTIDEGLIALAGLKENNTVFRKGYRVDRVALGKRNFSVDCAKVANFQAISRGYPEPILIGVGADILSRIVLTVDYTQKKVYIR